MTDINEFNEVEGITPSEEESFIPKPENTIIPKPWDDAPKNVYFYNKLHSNGRLGSYTQSAQMAYENGWDIEHNFIPIADTQISDIDNWPWVKDLCPMKTEEEKQKELAEQRFKDIKTAVQAVLNSKVKEKDYDDGFAVASYALSTNDTFRSDAARFIAWRDAVWARYYQILDAYKAGEIEMPSVENVLAVLPELEWNDE